MEMKGEKDMKANLKMKQIVTIMIVLAVLASSCTLFVSSAATGVTDPSNYKGGEANVEKIETLGNQIITIISTVGSIASVIVLVVLGLKYMMGSAEEKAEYKKTLMPYVIGAALVFAASAISSIIFGFAQNLG
jgi:type IV secretory pathway VirB2 component (pilin)